MAGQRNSEGEREKVGRRSNRPEACCESWNCTRPQTHTDLAGRQANTQVVYVHTRTHAQSGPEESSEHEHLRACCQGQSWPSPLAIVLLDLTHHRTTRLLLCLCVSIVGKCVSRCVCVWGGCPALCQAFAVFSKWGVLIQRVLRFHASAHSRRDLPEVTDCQPSSTFLPQPYTSSFPSSPPPPPPSVTQSFFPSSKYLTFSPASSFHLSFSFCEHILPTLSPSALPSVLPPPCLFSSSSSFFLSPQRIPSCTAF